MPSSPPQRRRVSQRAPKSCQLCTRRKLRCSKNIPCSNCVSRGKEAECRPEQVLLSKDTGRCDRTTTHAEHVEVRTAADSPLHVPDLRQSPSSTQRHDDGPSITHISCQQWEEPGTPPSTQDISDTPQTESTLHDPLPADTIVSLESVVWGSYSGSRGNANVWSTADVAAVDNITPSQEQAVLRFHQDQISWLHNFVHIDTFRWQCVEARVTGHLLGPAWRALYYAMMSTGLYYMGQRNGTTIDIANTAMLSKALYWKTLDALNDADYMATHSMSALQAMCVLVPCAYAFGDSKRIIVLLSTASSIAHLMRLHQLPSEPPSSAADQVRTSVEYEVAKRVWCFLVVQDSYLISFKQTYNIRLDHSRTPLPNNCPEDTGSWGALGRAPNLSLGTPTNTSYMILQYKLTCIKRKLHDETYQLDIDSSRTPEATMYIYDKVVQADEELEALRRDLPPWMKSATCAPDAPLWLRNQWRTFRISYSHMRLSIHRAFFCLSFTDRRYCFSQVACLDASRLLLHTYRHTAVANINADTDTTALLTDGWTILPHVVSANIVLALNMLLTSGERDGFDAHASEVLAQDERVMSECLGLITAAPTAQMSRVVKRGIILINRLLEKGRQRRAEGYVASAHPLRQEDIVRLIRDVEDTMLTEDEAALNAFNLSFGEFLRLFNRDSVTYL